MISNQWHVFSYNLGLIARVNGIIALGFTSGGSRGGSMGFMEPLFWRAAFENTIHKGIRTLCSHCSYTHFSFTVAITHMCQLIPVSRILRAHSLHEHIIISEVSDHKVFIPLPLQLGMAIYYQYESAYFPLLTWITCWFAASAARNGVTPLILWASNTTRFSSKTSNFCNFTPTIHQKRSQMVRNPNFFWVGMPPDPPSRLAMHALIAYWNSPFQNSRSATR